MSVIAAYIDDTFTWEDPEDNKNTKSETEKQSESEAEEDFEDLLSSYPFDQDHKFVGAAHKKDKMSRLATRQEDAPFVLDLHGMTTSEAQYYLQNKIDALLHNHKQITIKVITGRGRHSENGPVLADVCHRFIQEHYRYHIRSIESSPASSMINRIAVRGYFTVILARRL